MDTRQAIIELRKRGYEGEEIIAMARWARSFEKAFFNDATTLAVALIRYVKETRNVRWCWNCNGAHHIQQCRYIKAALEMDAEQFEMLQTTSRVMGECEL